MRGVIDTEIPELREVISMVALAPAAAPTVLDDVPELTEAVEEIEISSIVELPEDIDESSGWLHHDHGELKVVTTGPDSMIARFPRGGDSDAAPMSCPFRAGDRRGRCPHRATGAGRPWCRRAAPVEPPSVEAPSVEAPSLATAVAAPDAAAAPVASAAAPSADEWARWEVLADEIRMQVLQRIDLFTEARLRDAIERAPAADRRPGERRDGGDDQRAVGGLIRAYIAEAIEREIEKWRGAAR